MVAERAGGPFSLLEFLNPGFLGSAALGGRSKAPQVDLQGTKRALADAIVQADESLMASLSREDLALLLS